MRSARPFALAVIFSGIAIGFTGCRKDTSKPTTQDSSKPGGPAGTAFLDKKKQIPSGLEWNTDLTSTTGGQISFRIASQGPFSVTIVKDDAYQALKNNSPKGINKSDVLLTADSKEPTYEGKVSVPPGRAWFIIGNQASKEVEFHLQCFAP